MNNSPVRIVANITCGVVLILASLLRVLAGLCARSTDDRRRKRLFWGLILYAWLVSLGYAAVVGALATSANYCFRDCDEEAYGYVNRMTVWVLITTLLIPTVLVCSLGVCLTRRNVCGHCFVRPWPHPLARMRMSEKR